MDDGLGTREPQLKRPWMYEIFFQHRYRSLIPENKHNVIGWSPANRAREISSGEESLSVYINIVDYSLTGDLQGLEK